MIERQRGSQGGAGIDEDPMGRLGDAVRATALRSPDRIAITDGEHERSFAELAELLDAGGGSRCARTVGQSVADVEAILRAGLAGESVLLLSPGTTDWELERAETLFAAGSAAGFGGGPVVGLCSSGSSGLPKVVELAWEGLLANAASFAATAGYGEDDVLWCTTPLAHLYCLGAGVLGGLLSGSTVILSKGMLSPDEFAELASRQAPSVLLSVPFLFNRYLRLLEDAPEIAAGWSLRMAIAAGEPVSPQLIAAWRASTRVPLRSHYGLTEAGQITLANGGEGEGVGRPLDDVEVRIGESGEIAVRRRPPALPYRIVGREPAAGGWHETGDLGRLDDDGNLHIVGRADSRLNIAGKKVDPVEVEGVLGGCEGVEDCAVASVDGPDGPELAAFVCSSPDREIDDIELRAELAKRLSPHKLPRNIAHVREIPRTLTGKVRRGELIAGLGSPRRDDDDALDALTMVRREAAAVVLGRRSAAEIEPERSFKALGFDSLAAVTLCERLASRSGLAVSATAVFDHPTPASLAVHLEELASGAPAASIDLEFDRIEARLAVGGENERAHVLARLQALLARVSQVGDASGAVETANHQDLESVSDDEMIKLIDDEFGSA
jgi:non-ribosomal peptide synthetase component E (peptide arylation enzyme)/acyl carrier protein